jgi:dephospho-CoA kinase
VAEASQLLEGGTDTESERVLLIVAPEAERVRRWKSAGGDAADARRRIAAQISPDAAARRATDIIVNDGTLADLRRKTEELYGSWLKEAETRGES